MRIEELSNAKDLERWIHGLQKDPTQELSRETAYKLWGLLKDLAAEARHVLRSEQRRLTDEERAFVRLCIDTVLRSVTAALTTSALERELKKLAAQLDILLLYWPPRRSDSSAEDTDDL